MGEHGLFSYSTLKAWEGLREATFSAVLYGCAKARAIKPQIDRSLSQALRFQSGPNGELPGAD
jgi:hypothetical protein